MIVTVPLAALRHRRDRQRLARCRARCVSLASTSITLSTLSSATVAVSSFAIGSSLTLRHRDGHRRRVRAAVAVADRVGEAVACR